MCCHRQHKRYKEVYIEFPNIIWKWSFQTLTETFAGILITRGKLDAGKGTTEGISTIFM